jgi:hypothetical protein
MSYIITKVLPGTTIALTNARVDILITVRGPLIKGNRYSDWAVTKHGPGYGNDENCSDEYIRWHTNNAAVGKAPFTWVPFSCSTDTAIAVSKVSIMPTGVVGSTANISVEIMGEAPIPVCTVNS